MLPISISALVAGVLLVPASFGQDASAEWPHWQGPTHDGISAERDWSSTGAAEAAWSAELGVGYSNVSIADGRLFTIGFDEAEECDVVWCLDPETGDEIWFHTFPAKVHANFHSGGSLTTPTIDGARVYTSHRFGVVHCFDAETGEVVWHRDYLTELAIRLNFHGASASPLILGDHLYLTICGIVFALNKHDGEIVWQTPDFGEGGYSNLVPFDLEGRACLLLFDGRGLSVLDQATGESIQHHEFPHSAGGVSAATPIVTGTRAFISAAYNRGAALVELGGEEPDFLWYCRRMRNKVTACVLWEDHFYGFDESMLKCIDMEGNECWRVRGLGMGALSLAGERLLILSSKGELIVAEANAEEFVELSRRKVLDGGVYWTPPVLVHGLVYCRNSAGQFVCLDHRAPAVATTGEKPAAELALPDAATLFAAHIEAIGGEAAWREHTSMHLEGGLEITGAGITRTPLTIDLAAPAYRLLHFPIPRFGEVRRGEDGEIAWHLDPFNGNGLSEGSELRELLETQPIFAAFDWATIYPERRTVGRTTFGDRTCWQVDVVSKGSAKRSLYFDVETGRYAGRHGAEESRVIHADYREFEGLWLPTRITLLRPDTGEEEARYIEKVTFDQVDPAIFERPAEIAKLLWTPEEIAAKNAEAREKYGAYLGRYVGNFEPYAGRDFEMAIVRGDLVMRIPDVPEFALQGPDAEGWFTPGPGARLSVRFEEVEDGLAQTMHLKLVGGEPKLPRKVEDEEG